MNHKHIFVLKRYITNNKYDNKHFFFESDACDAMKQMLMTDLRHCAPYYEATLKFTFFDHITTELSYAEMRNVGSGSLATVLSRMDLTDVVYAELDTSAGTIYLSMETIDVN